MLFISSVLFSTVIHQVSDDIKCYLRSIVAFIYSFLVRSAQEKPGQKAAIVTTSPATILFAKFPLWLSGNHRPLMIIHAPTNATTQLCQYLCLKAAQIPRIIRTASVVRLLPRQAALLPVTTKAETTSHNPRIPLIHACQIHPHLLFSYYFFFGCLGATIRPVT